MFCSRCGAEVVVPSSFCSRCGAPLAPPAAAVPSPSAQPVPTRVPGYPPPGGAGGIPSPPYTPPLPNYLVPAILTTLFCCLPFGIVALVYSSQVQSKQASGDYQGALSASKNAKLWCWLSFGFGLAIAVIYLVAVVVVAANDPNAFR